MTMKSGEIDDWRNYFQRANADIFDVIEHAIIVAASDYPNEFKMKRDRIAETLFTCRLTRCLGCDRIELPALEEGNSGLKSIMDESGEGKQSKVNSSSIDQSQKNGNRVSNYSYDEAEALTEEIEEENQIIGEVLRIKELILNYEEESYGTLFESLRKLQLMALSVNMLQATEVGKAVSGLRKHGSKEIRRLARTLIDGWKEMVDEWVSAKTPIAATDGSPDSCNPSVLDEEGLPSPPLDEGAFFTNPPTSMELAQFFDGMDDDGNPCNTGEFDKKPGNGRKPTLENNNIPRRKPQTPYEANTLRKENRDHQMKNQETMIKQTKPSNDSGPRTPPKLILEHKANNQAKLQQKMNTVGVQNRAVSDQQNKSKGSDQVSVQVKLEASKRRLQEGYQQAENAKKQRTIQVMELCDLPRQGLGNKNSNVRTVNHNRHWSNGRR